MNLLDLLALYALVGVGLGLVVYRRAKGSTAARLRSGALALVLWPIWAPIALFEDAPPRNRGTGRAAKIDSELAQAEQAAAGSPFEALFPADVATRIRTEIRAALIRIGELDEVLARDGFDLDEAERRVGAVAETGSRRALETAVLHRDSVARIHALRNKQVRTLDELAELVGALRSQLILARYAGSSPEGVGGIVAELHCRVEGLSEVMDATDLEPSAARA